MLEGQGGDYGSRPVAGFEACEVVGDSSCERVERAGGGQGFAANWNDAHCDQGRESGEGVAAGYGHKRIHRG
jgi:hypothetical protein